MKRAMEDDRRKDSISLFGSKWIELDRYEMNLEKESSHSEEENEKTAPEPKPEAMDKDIWEGGKEKDDENEFRWCVWARYNHDNHWDSYPLLRTGVFADAKRFLSECKAKESLYYDKYLSSNSGKKPEELAGSWNFFLSVMERPCFLVYSRLVIDNASDRAKLALDSVKKILSRSKLPSEFGAPCEEKIFSWHKRNTVLRLVESIRKKLEEEAKAYEKSLGFVPRVECYPNTIHLNDDRELVTLDELYGEEKLSDDTDEGEEDDMTPDEEYEEFSSSSSDGEDYDDDDGGEKKCKRA